MIQSLSKQVTLSQAPLRLSMAAGTVFSFGWLLAHDQIHPVFLYCLQLFLSF